MHILWSVLLLHMELLPEIGIGWLQTLHDLNGLFLVFPLAEVEVDAAPGLYVKPKQDNFAGVDAQGGQREAVMGHLFREVVQVAAGGGVQGDWKPEFKVDVGHVLAP